MSRLHTFVATSICCVITGGVWLHFGSRPCGEPAEAYPTTRQAGLPADPESAPPQLIVAEPVVDRWAATHHRNLFSYETVGAPRHNAVVSTATRASAKPFVEPEVVPPVAGAPEPEFGYDYIGTFGPSHSPIAVFSRDGEVVTAQAGQTLGGFRVERVVFDEVSVRGRQSAILRNLSLRR